MTEPVIAEHEVTKRVTRGSGKGGQHRNTTDSKVVLTHEPTGIQASADGRCQHTNLRNAWAVLSARIQAHQQQNELERLDQQRAQQAGSGMRADKIRTYREKDGQVVDHRSNRKGSLKQFEKGNWEQIKI